jgi:uncharacterized Tic20 family protein
MSLSDEIERLAQLRASGAITEAEFAAAKQRLINGAPTPQAQPPPMPNQANQALSSLDTEKNWVLAQHLSQFAGYVVPFAGLVVPILIWQLKKADFPVLDPHGKMVANWLISAFIYGLCAIPLTLIGIGFIILIGLAILGIIFPIMGAIKGSEGQVWQYPFAIPFIK